MTQKPTSCTRHMDIKYLALCEWIERDLIHLERVDAEINTADDLTKSLTNTISQACGLLTWAYTSKILPQV